MSASIKGSRCETRSTSDTPGLGDTRRTAVLRWYGQGGGWEDLDSGRREAVARQADDDLARRSTPAVIIQPILCGLLTVLLPNSQSLFIGIPLATILLCAIVRGYLIRRRARLLSRRSLLWHGLFAATVLGTAAGWAGLCCQSVLIEGFAWETMLLIACAAAINTGATVTLSPAARLAIAYNVCFIVPIAICCLVVGGREGISVGSALAVQLAFCLAETRRAHAEHLGRLVGSALLQRDIAERERTEQALRRSRREFRQVIERSPDGIAVYREGRFAYVNQSWAQALGHDDPTALLGTEITSLLAKHVRESSPGIEHLPTGETHLIGREGRLVVFDLTAGQAIRFDGAPATLVMARDVTERDQMHQQLRLADRLASMGTVAASVAHEINNPLAYVIGNLDYITEQLGTLARQNGCGKLSELRGAAHDAHQGANRVREIVKDLKMFSHVDEISMSAFLPEQAAEAAVRLSAHEINRRARLVRKFEQARPVLGNEARLTQVLTNLLINAAQAIEPGNADGNEITLRTGTAECGSVVVEVSDTGTGIAAADLERVFDPFYTTKPAGVGTGLGLAICHSIVSDLQGRLTIDSTVGEGTTVSVTLPAAPPELT